MRTTQYEGEVKKLRIKVEQMKKDLLMSEEKVRKQYYYIISNQIQALKYSSPIILFIHYIIQPCYI